MNIMSETIVGRWVCEYCGATYAEYVNGCPRCYHGDRGRLSRVSPIEMVGGYDLAAPPVVGGEESITLNPGLADAAGVAAGHVGTPVDPVAGYAPSRAAVAPQNGLAAAVEKSERGHVQAGINRLLNHWQNQMAFEESEILLSIGIRRWCRRYRG